MTVIWTNTTWAAIAFISGPDRPPWWGEDNRGRHFDLRGLRAKKLVFHLRGEQGGERATIQLGILAGRPFGDSLATPIRSELLTLAPTWQRYELDLSTRLTDELLRICNGFGVLIERAEQPGTPAQTTVFIDDVFFE